jgi:hypothetical protein
MPTPRNAATAPEADHARAPPGAVSTGSDLTKKQVGQVLEVLGEVIGTDRRRQQR